MNKRYIYRSNILYKSGAGFTLIFGFVLLAFVFFFRDSFQKPYSKAAVIFPNITVTADVAETQEQKIKGLAGKTVLKENEGMLFLYDKPDYHTFWMKGMLIPIDILWIKDGYVVDIAENVPPPNDEDDLPLYKPKEPASEVLEVSAGFARKYSITVGESYTLSAL